MKKARPGFTIVEMLAVIGVVAVLISIIASVASNSIRAARSKRAAIMASSLQQAIAAYYAEEGKWPSLIENANTDGMDTIVFKGTQADQIFRAGADDFLRKPIQDKDIQPILERLSKRHCVIEEPTEPYGEVESGVLQFVFPTEYDGTSSIMPRVMESLSEDYFSIDDRISIELGLSELVTNAIEHGNLNITYDEKTAVADLSDGMEGLCNERLLDPAIASRVIKICYEFTPEECRWTITDEGNGFDVSKVPDPTKVEKREVLFHGRGIMFSRAIFDSVEYKGKGNEVVVTKKRNFIV